MSNLSCLGNFSRLLFALDHDTDQQLCTFILTLSNVISLEEHIVVVHFALAIALSCVLAVSGAFCGLLITADDRAGRSLPFKRTGCVACGGVLSFAIIVALVHLFNVWFAGYLGGFFVGIFIALFTFAAVRFRVDLLAVPAVLFGALVAALLLPGAFTPALAAPFSALWAAALSCNLSKTSFLFAAEAANSCIKRLHLDSGELTEAYRPAGDARVHSVLFLNRHD